VARQHGGRFLRLPPEINLGSPRFDEFYRQAAVKIRGKKPGETLLQRGQVMIYGLTIPRQAPSPRWATELVAFLLSEEGRAILLENGLQPLDPPLVDNPERLPALLRPLLKAKVKGKEIVEIKNKEGILSP
jgi:molybdate/tungstate transport system substrate-binding protein